VDPLTVRFTDLFEWCRRRRIRRRPEALRRKILEAIQMAWIDEME